MAGGDLIYSLSWEPGALLSAYFLCIHIKSRAQAVLQHMTSAPAVYILDAFNSGNRTDLVDRLVRYTQRCLDRYLDSQHTGLPHFVELLETHSDLRELILDGRVSISCATQSQRDEVQVLTAQPSGYLLADRVYILVR